MSGAKVWTRMCFAGEVESAVVNSAGFKERFGSLAAHPYNQDKPDQSIWWLFRRSGVPFSNWPAYSVGKYFFLAGKQFFAREDGSRQMRLGIHLEKGIEEGTAKKFYDTGRGRNYGMTSKWAWHGFLSDLENGALLGAIEEIGRRSGLPVEVAVEPSYPLDEPVLHEKFGFHRFEVTPGGGLKLVEEIQTKKVAGVGKVRSLAELADRLRRATAEEPWTWINCYVSVAVPHLSEPPTGAGPAWTGSDFWQRVLEPLAPWVR